MDLLSWLGLVRELGAKVSVLIRLLGEVSAGADAGSLASPGGRVPAAVLAHLALAGGRVVVVDALVDAVWDTPTGSARNAVQVAVSRLRRQFGAELVDGGRVGYRLRTAMVRVDWFEVEQLLAEARQGLDTDRFGAALSAAERALVLFAGEPLAGLDSIRAVTARAQASQLRTSVVLVRARALLGLRRAEEAVEGLREETTGDPLGEPAHALLMEALAGAGRPAEALTVYDQLRHRLGDQLGVDPSPSVAAVFTRLLAGDIQATTSAATAGAPIAPLTVPVTVVLPSPGTPLLGRDGDVDLVVRLIHDGHRLVTLVGPGGIGKTRLAVEVARRVGTAQARPVVFTDLTLAREPADVATTVAAALDTDPESLTGALAGTAMLLVLDNAEHLLTAVADLVTALLAVDGIGLIVTSRSPLRLHAERTVEVDGLAVGGAGSPAVQLIADRSGLSDDEITTHSASLVSLAQRMDGVPLVLELLASALRWRTPEQVLAELTDTFTDLTDTTRDRPERHASITAVVGWSVAQASPAAHRGLAALTVIRGTFTETAATAIITATNPDVPSRAVLAELVDLSLVKRLRQPGTIRFRILEPIRLHLEQSPDTPPPDHQVRQAHAHHYLTELDQAHQTYAEDSNLFEDLIRDEDPNLVQAITWTWDHEPTTAMHHLGTLLYGWFRRDRHTDIHTWTERVLASPHGSAVERAQVMVVRLLSLIDRAELTDELRQLSAAVQPHAEALDDNWHRNWIRGQANRAQLDGDLETALAWTERFRLNTALTRSWASQHRGSLLALLGRRQEAYDEQAAGLAEAPIEHHRTERAIALSNLGYQATALRRYDQAQIHLDDALDLATRHEMPFARTLVEMNLAWLEVATGRPARALARVLFILDRPGEEADPESLTEAFIIAGLALVQIGRTADARVVATGALQHAHETPGLLMDPYIRDVLDRLVHDTATDPTDSSHRVSLDQLMSLIQDAATVIAHAVGGQQT